MTDQFLKFPYPHLSDQLGPVLDIEITINQAHDQQTGPFGLPNYIRQQLDIDPLLESVMLDLTNVIEPPR